MRSVAMPEKQGNPGRLAPAGVLRPSSLGRSTLGPLRLAAAGLLPGRLLRSRLLAAALLAAPLLGCHSWVSPLLGGPGLPGFLCRQRLSDPRGNGLEANRASSSVFSPRTPRH